MDKKREGWFVTGLLVGGVAAFVASRLLAPSSGAEFRSDLVRRGKELRASAATRAAELGSQGTSKLREVSQRGVSTVCRPHQPRVETTAAAAEATRIEEIGSASTHTTEAGGDEPEKP